MGKGPVGLRHDALGTRLKSKRPQIGAQPPDVFDRRDHQIKEIIKKKVGRKRQDSSLKGGGLGDDAEGEKGKKMTYGVE